MPSTEKSARLSVTMPAHVAHQVRTIVRTRRVSTNRVLVELIEAGLEAKEQERRRFFDLAERFREAKDPAEVERLKREVAREVFGE